ncbi:MAG: hypothetical protein ACQEP8_06460 [Chlamydiota bacterium]
MDVCTNTTGRVSGYAFPEPQYTSPEIKAPTSRALPQPTNFTKEAKASETPKLYREADIDHEKASKVTDTVKKHGSILPHNLENRLPHILSPEQYRRALKKMQSPRSTPFSKRSEFITPKKAILPILDSQQHITILTSENSLTP